MQWSCTLSPLVAISYKSVGQRRMEGSMRHNADSSFGKVVRLMST